MIVSYSQSFIFIKTRKTAGTSLEIALSRFCNHNDIVTPLSSPLNEQWDEERLRRREGGYVRADVLQLEGWEMCRRMSFERNSQKPKFYINDWQEFGCRLNLHRD